MPRLRNERTGAVVSCSQNTASRLGSEWVDADAPIKRAPGRPKKSEVAEQPETDQ